MALAFRQPGTLKQFPTVWLCVRGAVESNGMVRRALVHAMELMELTTTVRAAAGRRWAEQARKSAEKKNSPETL